MDFEKKLSEMFNQPSFQKKQELKDGLIDLEFLSSKFSFVRTRWFYRNVLKYKLMLRQFNANVLWTLSKKTAAFSMAAFMFVSFVALPMMSGPVWNDVNYQISSVSGDVFVYRGSEKMQVNENMELFASDVISVGSNSIAQLELSDSSLVRLGQNSTLELGQFAETPFIKTATLHLDSGSAWINTDFASVRPVNVELSTPHFDFDIYKASKIAVKVNSNSILTYNYQKPVAYKYLDKTFILKKSSKAVLNENSQSDIFRSNMTAFMNVNQKLDQAFDIPLESSNRQIAGVLPGDFMYSFDVIDNWLDSLVTVGEDRKIDKQIDDVSERIAEVDLLASASDSLVKVKKELDSVVKAVKVKSTVSDSSSKKVFIDKISQVEKSLDKSSAPEVYFELKSMISKAKLEVSDDTEKSSLALDSANELLTDIANADASVKQKVLPKVIDEVNYVLSSIKNTQSNVTASNLKSNDLKTVLEDTMIVSQTLEQNIITDKLLTDKVNELKTNLEDLADQAELEVIEVEPVDSFIEFDAQDNLQVETADFDSTELLDSPDEESLDLQNIELPEDLNASDSNLDDSVNSEQDDIQLQTNQSKDAEVLSADELDEVDVNLETIQPSDNVLEEEVSVELPDVQELPEVEQLTEFEEIEVEFVEIKNSESDDTELEEILTEEIEVEFR